jgi:hypothetical protein
VIAATVLLFVAPLVSRWWRAWRTYKRPDYFLAYVASFSTTNNDLSLSLAEPMPLHGVRCEVRRSEDSIIRAAESTDEGAYGLPGNPSPLFPYPSGFSQSNGSLPQPGELCRATWYVRAARDGEWLFAAEGEFRFGEFRDAHGELPANYQILEVELRRGG